MNIEPNNKTNSYNSTETIVWSCRYHIIWCTKYRRRVLEDSIQIRLKQLFFELQQTYNYKIIETEIMADHIHLLLDASPQISIDKLIGRIKGRTSHILCQEFPALRKKLPTLWTRSKFIATCGTVSLEVVQKYIEEQKNK